MKRNSVKNLIEDFKDKLAIHYPVHEIMNILYLLFEEIMEWPKTRVHLSYDAEIPEKEWHAFYQFLNGLAGGRPIQYLMGWTQFDGCRIKVNSSVLIPRPETEELCSVIKSDLSHHTSSSFSILDIGTGSGCIPISLKKFFLNAAITGIDVSKAAIDLAILNAKENHCKIEFRQSDIFNDKDCFQLGLFDLIVSNPPYVLEREKQSMHRNVIDFEPHNALFVPDTDPLLFYRAIAGFSQSHLAQNGSLYLEINEQFGMETSRMVQSFGFEKVEVLSDIHGKNRFVRASSAIH
ncbi:MAG: peptide chain release factor N(5)-glutamine methyltransferase [Bacteroidota bacterium]